MTTFTLPVYMNTPLPLSYFIDAARSVRDGCRIAQHQDLVVLRSRLSEAQNHRCCWCAHRFADTPALTHSPTLEHIVPRALGGSDHPDNLAVSCVRCNRKRGTLSIPDFLARVHHHGWHHPQQQTH